MAVLIEAISVVIDNAALLAAFGNDWERFKRTVPNATLCADGELVRVGFMTPTDVEHYIKLLEAHGLRHFEDGQAKSMVVVDQQRGPLQSCDWVEFGHITLDGDARKRVAACRAKDSASRQLFKPDGWTFESSLSSSFGFVPTESVEKSLKLLRSEDGLDVYWNEHTGKEIYIGRTRRERK